MRNSILFFMIFTLVVSPLPLEHFKVYAAEEGVPQAGCSKDPEQKENEVFTVGCDAAAAVQAANMSSNTGDQGVIIGIIQQAVGAMMALVLIKSILYKYTKYYRNDCQMDKTGKTTLLMAQLSSLSYIIGDLVSNVQFKKLAEEATKDAFLVTNKADDKNTQGDAKKEATKYNQEQIRAFDTMIKVFDGQQKAMGTKLTLAAVAEAGYIAAEVVELLGITGTTTACTTSYTTYTSAKTPILATLSSLISTATTEAATYSVCPGPSCNPAGAAACGALAGQLAAKVGRENAMTATKAAKGSANNAKKAGLFAKALKPVLKLFKGLKNVVKGDKTKVEEVTDTIDPTEAIDKQIARAESIVAKTQRTTEKATDKTETTAIKATSACTVNSPLAQQAAEAEAKIDKLKVLCCGIPNGAEGANIVAPGLTASISRDLEQLDALFSSAQDFDPKDIMLKIIENNLYAQSFKLFDENLSSKENLNNLSSYWKDIDSGMQYIHRSLENHKFDETILETENSLAVIETIFKTLSSKLTLVGTAKADGLTNTVINGAASAALKIAGNKVGGTWGEILNYGSKYFALNALFGKLARNWAFVRPKNRAITWGLMTAVNAAIIVFDASTLKKIKKHKKIIEQEKKKFLAAAGDYQYLGEGTGEGGGEGEGGDDNFFDYSNQPMFGDGDPNIIACVSPKAGGFIPDTCRGKRSTKPYSIPKPSFNSLNSEDSKALFGSMNFLSGSTYKAGSGAFIKNPALLGTTFAQANNHNNAISKIRDKLRKDVDSLEKTYAPAGKDGKKILTPLAKIGAELNKVYGKPIAVQPELAKSLLADKDEKKKTAVIASVKLPKTSIPSGKSRADTFDLDFDDGPETVAEDDLALEANSKGEIVVEHKDIVKKPEASIFKLLSNRYLVTYPKLLEEKK